MLIFPFKFVSEFQNPANYTRVQIHKYILDYSYLQNYTSTVHRRDASGVGGQG